MRTVVQIRAGHRDQSSAVVPAWARSAGLGFAIVFALAGTGRCQYAQSQSGLGGASGVGGTNGIQGQAGQGFGHPQVPALAGDPDIDAVMAERRIRALNLERQKRMVADTNKLLALAKELNDEVAAEKSGSLNAEQLHKITEIEKLARSVRERMTAGMVDVPGFPPPMAPNFPSRPGLGPQ